MGGTTFDRARADFKAVVSEGVLDVSLSSKQRFDPHILQAALKFMLSQEHVGTLSWGTKQVRLDPSETVVLPRLIRRFPAAILWQNYTAHVPTPHISRASFYRILRNITSSDQKVLSAVDYVTGCLVNDPIDTLRRIAKDFSSSPQHANELHALVDLCKNFLKSQFDAHARKADNCTFHGLHYGLDPTFPERDTVQCKACNFPSYVTRHLQAVVRETQGEPEVAADACRVLVDIEHKFDLYCGHRLRVVNQHQAIDCIHKELRQECMRTKAVSTSAVVIADWKVKWEPRYYRETTRQHFGKRGISWHGYLLHFYDYDAINDEAVRKTVYCDQVIDGSNKQDGSAVLATLEAFLQAIRARLPFIQSICLQSDNAGCYRSSLLRALIPVIAQRSGVAIRRFVHSETQDGTCLIDAHFAQGTNHCMQYLKTGKDVATPSELYAALASHGGIPNSFVQLIRLNRARQDALVSQFASLTKKITLKIGRVNDVTFYTENTSHTTDGEAYDLPSFFLHAFEYSDIGAGTQYRVSLQQLSLHSHLQLRQTDSQPSTLASERDMVLEGMDTGDDEEDDNDSDDDTVDFGGLTSGAVSPTATGGDTVSSFMGHQLVSHTALGKVLGPRGAVQQPTVNNNEEDSDDASSCADNTGKRRDLVACAVRLANDLILHHSSIRDGTQDMEEYDLAAGIERTMLPGWARRPRSGKMYGAKYVDAYRQDLESLFHIGAKDTSNKVGPSAVLEALRDKYPGRYSLPGEGDITSIITSLFQKQKKPTSQADPCLSPATPAVLPPGPPLTSPSPVTAVGAGGAITGAPLGTRKRTRIPQQVVQIITGILQQQPTAKPAHVLKLVKEYVTAEHGGIPEWLPPDSKLKTKISNMKATPFHKL
eukprot:m.244130 g.244130  ORF g.244130 m.244130 type:complete len:880 (-) comp15351_c0_seq3:204-2843(-)